MRCKSFKEATVTEKILYDKDTHLVSFFSWITGRADLHKGNHFENC